MKPQSHHQHQSQAVTLMSYNSTLTTIPLSVHLYDPTETTQMRMAA